MDDRVGRRAAPAAKIAGLLRSGREHDISAYLITITIMNAAVGLTTALAMWLRGLGDPILWGVVAFLLNYVPTAQSR